MNPDRGPEFSQTQHAQAEQPRNNDNLDSTKVLTQQEEPNGRASSSGFPPIAHRTHLHRREFPIDDSGTRSSVGPALSQRPTGTTALSRVSKRSLAPPEEVTSRKPSSVRRAGKRSASMGRKQEDSQGTKRVLRSRHSLGSQSNLYRPISLTSRPVAPTGPTQPPTRSTEVAMPESEIPTGTYVASPDTAPPVETRPVLRSGRVCQIPPTKPRKSKSNADLFPTDAPSSSVVLSESTEERTLLRPGHIQSAPSSGLRKSEPRKSGKKTYVERILQDDEDLFSCGLTEDEEDVYFARKAMDFLRQNMHANMCGDRAWFPNIAMRMQAIQDEQE